jgi:hypothetical protein
MAMPTGILTSRRIYVSGRAPITAAAASVNAPGQTVAPAAAAPKTTATTCCCPACTGLACLDRTRFFSGQLLSEADLNNEQSYWLAKSRLHNRYLVGWGVVCGLQVVCSECDGWVTVKSGYAIDPCGNDIVVCSDQNFNVLKAIQACCASSSQTSNCSPVRYNPPAECQNTPQHWCITIEYQEQQSRMVTPLVQTPSKSCSCGCGGSSKGGCGCGCGGSNGSMMSSSNGGSTSSCGCSSTQTQTSSTVPTGACEPTRILETFKLGICPAPSPTVRGQANPPAPGTAAYQYQACIQGLDQLIAMQPVPFAANSDLNSDYQATCSYLSIVNAYFAQNQFLTHCTLLDTLAQIPIPVPGPNTTPDAYNNAVAQILAILALAKRDCFCMALIPSCPPNPCDDRLILACLTVQNGVITNICPFEGRQQLIGFTALNYWFGSLFGNLLQILDTALEGLCCNGANDRKSSLFPAALAYDRTNVTTDGISNPAVFNRMFSTLLAQKLGAATVNVISPQTRAVDMRPFVGQSSQDAVGSLTKQGFTVFSKDVSDDLSWDATAIAAAAQFAPAAVSTGQALTAYTKGGVLVGVEVTDPTTALQNQVAALQKRVDELTGPSPNTGAAPASSPRAKKST